MRTFRSYLLGADDSSAQKALGAHFPNPDVIRLAAEYKARYHIGRADVGPALLNVERAMRIADAYDIMVHAPYDPAVMRGYDALNREVLDQYTMLADHGYQMRPWHDNEAEPYKNSLAMLRDVRDNKHLWYLPTFGPDGQPAFGEQNFVWDNPLLAQVPSTGRPYNDLFRAVHDIFGHAAGGYQFGPQGEENAWRAHSAMFSPEALAVATTELRGQNSWVNFGPHLRRPDGTIPVKGDPDYVPLQDRPFADQKANILPAEFLRPDGPMSLQFRFPGGAA